DDTKTEQCQSGSAVIIARLAEKFDVSEQAMEYWLANLGLAMPPRWLGSCRAFSTRACNPPAGLTGRSARWPPLESEGGQPADSFESRASCPFQRQHSPRGDRPNYP